MRHAQLLARRPGPFLDPVAYQGDFQPGSRGNGFDVAVQDASASHQGNGFHVRSSLGSGPAGASVPPFPAGGGGGGGAA